VPLSLCRVIATKAAVPLVYVPLEGVSSKWCVLSCHGPSQLSQHLRHQACPASCCFPLVIPARDPGACLSLSGR
jgi:hypothetical protein